MLSVIQTPNVKSIRVIASSGGVSLPERSAAPPSRTSQHGTPLRSVLKPANQTTFQLICAGQDGDFGLIDGAGGDNDVKIATGALAGTNFNAGGGDKDNITNFSNGRMLGDLIQ